jgi:hypothetical protein
MVMRHSSEGLASLELQVLKIELLFLEFSSMITSSNDEVVAATS